MIAPMWRKEPEPMVPLELLMSVCLGAVGSAGCLSVLAHALPNDFVLACVSERSNHVMPARQIGGLGVVPAVLVLLVTVGPAFGLDPLLATCLGASGTILLVTGHLDDRSDLPVAVRVAAQSVACTIAVFGLGPDFHLLANIVPREIEVPVLIIALMWFINLTNFMDGLDLMVVAGLGVPLLAVLIFALSGRVASDTGVLAGLLAGALAAFGLFNRPPARIFLGDAGSLPIGLMAGITFFKVALDTHVSTGFVLPLYFCADASVTVVMRMLAGEPIFAGHSRHAYQVARRKGWSVLHVIGWVATLNAVLALCALGGLLASGQIGADAGFVVAAAAVAFVIVRFRQGGEGQLPR